MKRGTKRSADSAPSGPKAKSAKSGPASKPFNKKGGDFKGKGKTDSKPKRDFSAPKAFTKAAPAKKEEPAQRRKRPVTQGGGDEEVEDDDAMSVDGEGDEYEGAEEEANGAGAGGEEGEKRGKMSKAERAAMHAANPHRKTLMPSHALLTETLLPLWETARRLEMPKDERKVAIEELWGAVKGHVLEISRGHKGGRILQTVSSA